MTNCCVCQLTIRNVRHKFDERIGNPRIPISKLVEELVHGTSHLFAEDSAICRKCCEKLLCWHNAVRVAQQMQHELLQLLEKKKKHLQWKPAESEANRRLVGDAERESETEHLSVSKVEIKLECDSIENADPIEFSEQEVIMNEMIPSPPLNNFLETKMITNNFEFVSEKSEIKTDSKSDNDDDDSDKDTEVFNNDDADFKEKNQTRSRKTKAVTNIRHTKEKTKEVKNSSCFPKDESKNVAADVDVKCAECNQTFTNQRQYSAHVKKKHSTGFICDQCGKTLQSYPGLTKHILNHNPVKPFECPECGKGFHLPGHLKRHIAEHENGGESVHKCDVCARRFYYLYDLQRHQMWHDDSSRRIACDVCGLKFRTQPHLNRHMATHTGAKPHRCPICGKCFAQLYNMRVHHREHEQPGSTRQRRLKCNKCSRTFTNKDKYQMHCERSECEVSATL